MILAHSTFYEKVLPALFCSRVILPTTDNRFGNELSRLSCHPSCIYTLPQRVFLGVIVAMSLL